MPGGRNEGGGRGDEPAPRPEPEVEARTKKGATHDRAAPKSHSR